MIKIQFLRAAVLPLILLACGCATTTENGALAGGALGAGAGAIAGHALHNTAAGALIGAGAGAITGGLVGNQIEKKEERQAEAAAAQASQQGIAQVVSMTRSGVNESIIINNIRVSPTIYHLNDSDIAYLKQNGVTDGVVNEMIATGARYPRRIYSAAPYYPPPPYYGAPVYYVEPAPPPPVAVGVGFSGRWH